MYKKLIEAKININSIAEMQSAINQQLADKVIIPFGAPGAGKGTFSDELEKVFHSNNFSTGAKLREITKNPVTKSDFEIIKYMNSGKFVPDEYINQMVIDVVLANNPQGIMLDGYPRTSQQAELITKTIQQNNKKIIVIYLDASVVTITARAEKRLYCKDCGKTFSTEQDKAVLGKACPKCGEGHPLTSRKDDEPETVKTRHALYLKETQPILDYFKNASVSIINYTVVSDDKTYMVNAIIRDLYKLLITK